MCQVEEELRNGADGVAGAVAIAGEHGLDLQGGDLPLRNFTIPQVVIFLRTYPAYIYIQKNAREVFKDLNYRLTTTQRV